MNLRRTAAMIAIAFSAATMHAQSPPSASLLAQLDAASKAFKNAQADVKQDIYTRVVRADDLETGSIYFERAGSGENMGAVMFDPGPDGKPSKSPSKIYSFDGANFLLYTPGVNQVDVFKPSASQAKINSFLTLGFGGSGTDLAKSWNVNDQGSESIDGVKTEKLDLTGKDASVTSLFSHITIWIDPARGISLKQIFFQPNGDMRTTTYSNIKLNTHIDKRPYAISSKATRIQH